MVTAWRIAKASRAASAFDGEGARLHGGRWNSIGTPMIYTADSAALAALEMLVHLGGRGWLATYVVIPCSFDEELVTTVDRRRLPADWKSFPAPTALRALADDWVRTLRSAVLEVPSAVIGRSSNYLLNPRHREFPMLRIGNPEAFEFDPRLRSR